MFENNVNNYANELFKKFERHENFPCKKTKIKL